MAGLVLSAATLGIFKFMPYYSSGCQDIPSRTNGGQRDKTRTNDSITDFLLPQTSVLSTELLADKYIGAPEQSRTVFLVLRGPRPKPIDDGGINGRRPADRRPPTSADELELNQPFLPRGTPERFRPAFSGLKGQRPSQ